MESLILQFSLKYLEGIKFQYVDVDFIVAELKKARQLLAKSGTRITLVIWDP